mgnify:CR=1 FL=1
MSNLTPKQDAFVKAYLLNGGNGTQAAIDAGYSEKTAKAIGSENLTKPDVKAAIDEHRKKCEQSFIWSKEKKLEMLQKLVDKATENDPEKGMINMPSAIAALKEHNLMMGDNAPAVTENTHKIIKADETEW